MYKKIVFIHVNKFFMYFFKGFTINRFAHFVEETTSEHKSNRMVIYVEKNSSVQETIEFAFEANMNGDKHFWFDITKLSTTLNMKLLNFRRSFDENDNASKYKISFDSERYFMFEYFGNLEYFVKYFEKFFNIEYDVNLRFFPPYTYRYGLAPEGTVPQDMYIPKASIENTVA
jgi:hypothetical protein